MAHLLTFFFLNKKELKKGAKYISFLRHLPHFHVRKFYDESVSGNIAHKIVICGNDDEVSLMVASSIF